MRSPIVIKKAQPISAVPTYKSWMVKKDGFGDCERTLRWTLIALCAVQGMAKCAS